MTPVEVLAAHPIHFRTPSMGRVWCGCGLPFDARDTHAAHVLDALAQAGHVVVTLPEPATTEDLWAIWLDPNVAAFRDGTVAMNGVKVRPEYAKRYAAALLAATAAAEPTAKETADE